MSGMQARSVSIVEDGYALDIEWQSGERNFLEARQLWRDCPSAHARRRRLDRPTIVPDASLRIVSVAPIGLYAINITFSDGHDRGIYPWTLLREFATKPTIADYLID